MKILGYVMISLGAFAYLVIGTNVVLAGIHRVHIQSGLGPPLIFFGNLIFFGTLIVKKQL
jgi:hypothetical protein